MRLTVFSLFLILVLAVSATAAGSFGVKGGGVLANLTGSDAGGTDATFGFAGGEFMRAPLGESGNRVLQPEVRYVMKGTQEKAFGVTVKFKFDYVEVPVLVKFNMSTESNIRPNLFVGPAVAFKVSSKISAMDAEVDIDEAIKAVDFGLAFGGGLDFGMAGGNVITFDARYTLGFANIFDVDPAPNVKNGVMMFMLGYLF